MTKCAIITGASRGIGRAIATQLASEGFSLIINYNNSKFQAEELSKELQKKYNINAFHFKADVSNENDIDEMVNFAVKKFGKIDVLVNNAGVCVDLPFEERTVSSFQKTFKTNLFSVFYLSKLVGRIMKKNKFGKIVNISSNNSINGFYPTTIDYDASKSALNSLTKNLSIEFAPYVNVNAVAPGWIDTDMNKEVLTDEIAKLECERILKRRIGTPQDVANLVSFLVSDKADYIDGEVIVIDGGMF
ncbi:MAG: 3-oxoacyl-ACP reductase FabG [Clostridia bacterium]|nr:3-oxoacyl-ACP reductase FabG [Clostridia bacterium]